MPKSLSVISNTQNSQKKKYLVVHLYKNFFTLGKNEQPIPYNGPMASFVDSMNKAELNADVMQSWPGTCFHEGKLLIECLDHR